MRNKWKISVIVTGLLGLLLMTGLFFFERETQKRGVEEVDTETVYDNIEHIIVTYQTMDNSRTDDICMVAEAINEISREEIGVEIELKIDAALDSFIDYPLWISQDEQVDLMILNFQDITGYISSSMLNPLDSLLDHYGSGIKDIIGEGNNITQGAVVNGKTYGVTNVFEMDATGGGIWISKRLLDEIGVDYDKEHIYTYDELTDLFELLKGRYPDSYPLGQLTSDAVSTSFTYYDLIDENIAESINTGVIVDGEVADFYETQEYYKFLVQMRYWYEKGYIFPDAAFTDETLAELYASGKILSKPFSSVPGMADDLNDSTVVCLKTTPVRTTIKSEKSGFWVIPKSSRCPGAAMQFLNLMLTDTRIGNLFKWGIEGIHYVKVDSGETDRRITFPEGLDAGSVGYYNPMQLYGDYRKIYTMDSVERTEEIEEYNESAIKRTDICYGFAYDKTRVSDKVAAVENVIEKYVPVLESGSVDLDIYYTEFIEKLNQAGMPEILADKQAQFDVWQAETDKDGKK